MLTFFRRIRKGLLGDGATSKYLIYAIGEILLVMIGILLALQVNNWNGSLKERQFEKKVLSEIMADTKKDLVEMSNALDYLNSSEQSCNIILKHITKGVMYHDSMDVHFAKSLQMWSLTPNSTAFEMAKSEGLYLISNDSIRSMVARINHYWLDYIRVLENRWHDYRYNTVVPHCTPLFEYMSLNSMPPLSYSHLQSDSIYTNILKTLSEMRQYYLKMMKSRYELLVKLNVLIKNELSKSE